MVSATRSVVRETLYGVGSVVGGVAMTLVGYVVVSADHDMSKRPVLERIILPFDMPVLNVLGWTVVFLVLCLVWRRIRLA